MTDMDTRFLNFATDVLGYTVTMNDYQIAKRILRRDDAQIVEINNAAAIWKDLPMRGRQYYVLECQRLNDQVTHEFLNRPRVSYTEYVNTIEERVAFMNSEMDEDEFEEYSEPILSESDYNNLPTEEYVEIMHISLPILTSPYIYFCKTLKKSHNALEFSTLSFTEAGNKLGGMWQDLPDKGKLDY